MSRVSLHLLLPAYRISLGLYQGIIQAAAWLGHPKALALVQGRSETLEILHDIRRSQGDSPAPPTVWFHAASTGEVEQAKPLMQAWKALHPHDRLVLSVYSPSAYRSGKDPYPADLCLMMLGDQPDLVALWMDTLRPYRAFFVKYEYWYFHWKALGQNKIPLVMICALLHAQSGVLKPWFRPLWQEMAGWVTCFAVQDPGTLEVLKDQGLRRAVWVGDTRFDRVVERAETYFSDPVFSALTKNLTNEAILVAGSTWERDENLLLRTWQALKQRAGSRPGTLAWKLILVPHEWNKARQKELERRWRRLAPELRWVYYSQASQNLEQLKPVTEADVLVVDQSGLLSRLYRYGKAAWIGGGFGAGIHNSLEAAVYGLPLAFGPRYRTFPEAVSLVDQKMAFPIQDQGSLGVRDLVAFLDKAGAYTPDLHQQIKDQILANTGATQRILELDLSNSSLT
ncbi:MAG: 3-deoxy-D-manno-octulosonic acid transferase [Bacteroidota bacterium]